MHTQLFCLLFSDMQKDERQPKNWTESESGPIKITQNDLSKIV